MTGQVEIPALHRWRRARRYRFGCAGLLSAALHGVLALWIASLMVRLPEETPPIRVLVRPPAAAGSAPAAEAAGAVSPAEVMPPPKPAVVRAPHKGVARRILRRSQSPPPAAGPVDAFPGPSAQEHGNGTVTGVGGAGPGGFGDGLSFGDPARDQPVLLSKVIPEYPLAARLRGIEGQVVLQAVVAADGRIEPDITVVESVPLLDKAAVSALRRWRFRPAHDRNGAPLRVTLQVPVKFVLR